MSIVEDVGKKVVEEVIEPVGDTLEDVHDKVKEHPRHFQWGFQTFGDVGLAVSGVLTQNYGRAATGLLGLGRGASYFAMRSVMEGHRAETICAVAALGTNMPQLMRAATTPEMAAVALVMTGWSLRALPGLLNEMASKKVHKLVSGPVQRLKDAFAGVNGHLFGTLPAAIFATRGVMQLTDGIVRKDYSAMGAGLCFIFGGVAGYYAGRKHFGPAAQQQAPTDQLPPPGPA